MTNASTEPRSDAHDSAVFKIEVQPSFEEFLDEVGETIAARTGDEATNDEPTDARTTAREPDTTPGESPHHPYKVSFHSRQALHRAVREETIDLLEAVATEHPESIRDLARRLDRDVRRVHDDVTELADLHLLDLEPGDGRAKRPVVWYDELEVSIPLRPEDAEREESA